MNKIKKFRHWHIYIFITIFLLTIFSFSGCAPKDAEGPGGPVRETLQGNVVGADEETMYAFRGIPYAAPPVDDLRLAATQPAVNRATTLNAREFRASCPQPDSAFQPEGVRSEDCLFLNIYTPKGAKANDTYPVMVWIHGGALIYGSGRDPGYDPKRLVAEDVIVVTMNYRLGALGFMTHPALADEAGQSGNYGLLDQQEALRWIQANIAFFGGDPNNVTIFGESAGGHSVMSQLVAPSSDGLFQKAIAQSGSYSATQLNENISYYVYGAPFADVPGLAVPGAPCGGLADHAAVRACLRSLTQEQIFQAQGDTSYIPVNGNTFLPKSIDAALTDGDFADVPVMIGSNRTEGQLFVILDIANGQFYNDHDLYLIGVEDLLGLDPRDLDLTQIANDYEARAAVEVGGSESPAYANRFRVALSNLWTDYFFACPTLNQWGKLSTYTDTYGYWFTDANAPSPYDALAPFFAPTKLGTTHAQEIQYVFGQVGARGGNAAQVALSELMVGFWTQFAKTGSPNTALTAWQEYRSGSNFVMKFDTPAIGTNADDFGGVTKHNCTYWANPPLTPPIP